MNQIANLYLVGAPKAGTTSLASWLGAHPDVYWSTPKEPFFWASDYPRQRAHHGFSTIDEYARLYSSAEASAATWRGDGSTTYLYSRSAVPDILSRLGGQARFLVMLRKPVDLVLSYHRTQVIALNEPERDFSAAWTRSIQGIAPQPEPLDIKLVDYRLVGAQGAAVRRLLTSVSRDHVRFLLFDELRDNPRATWANVVEFLGLDPRFTPSFSTENASTSAARWPALRRFVHRPPRLLRAPVAGLRSFAARSESTAVATLRKGLWKDAERPHMDRRLRGEIEDYFAEDVDELEGLIGRSTGWLDKVD